MSRGIDSGCAEHAKPEDCPDNLIWYSPRFDAYSIPIRDGGGSSVSIAFCPWCGAHLPDSKHSRWITELENLGISEPDDPRIPEEFQTDRWWRKTP